MCYGYYPYTGWFSPWSPPHGIGHHMWGSWTHHPYGGMWQMPHYQPPGGFVDPRIPPFGAPMTPEQEIDFLRDQARILKEQLDQIEARIKEFDKGNN